MSKQSYRGEVVKIDNQYMVSINPAIAKEESWSSWEQLSEEEKIQILEIQLRQEQEYWDGVRNDIWE